MLNSVNANGRMGEGRGGTLYFLSNALVDRQRTFRVCYVYTCVSERARVIIATLCVARPQGVRMKASPVTTSHGRVCTMNASRSIARSGSHARMREAAETYERVFSRDFLRSWSLFRRHIRGPRIRVRRSNERNRQNVQSGERVSSTIPFSRGALDALVVP